MSVEGKIKGKFQTFRNEKKEAANSHMKMPTFNDNSKINSYKIYAATGLKKI